MARLLSMGFIAALAVFAALVANGGVRAEDLPSVRVAGTDPPLGWNLARNWPLYVHLRYQGDVPLRVQVKGFLDDAEVTDG